MQHQWGTGVVVCVCGVISVLFFMSEVTARACSCVQGLYAMSMNCMEAAEAQFKTALEANKVPLRCPPFLVPLVSCTRQYCLDVMRSV